MRKYLFIAIILSFSFSNTCQSSQAKNNLTYIIRLTYNLKFDQALDIVNDQLRDDSLSLQWKFFHAMILFRKSIYFSFQKTIGYTKNENEVLPLQDSSIAELKKIIQLGKKILKDSPEDTTALFYVGAAYGYIGINYVKEGNYFKGASEGKTGLDYHDKLMKLCPYWADVYLSEGVFNYYASGLPWYLKPVLWIIGKSGSESNAKKYLEFAGEKGQYSKYEAMEFLAKLYIRENKPDSADVIINKLTLDLPNGKYYYYFRFGMDMLSDKMLYESNKLIMEGINISKHDTLTTIDKLEVGYMYVYLADAYFNAGNYNKVIELWQDLINRNILPSEDSRGYILLGDSYLKLDNKAEAEKCYKWILNNSSNEKYINSAWEKLNALE